MNKIQTIPTHESYVQAVVAAAKAILWERGSYKGIGPLTADATAKLDKLNAVKVVYGLGETGLRGVTWFEKWHNGKPVDLIEVCAFGQQNWTQVAATTIHELAHVIAGPQAGHDKTWKAACHELGLRLAKVHQNYNRSQFDPKLRQMLNSIPLPADGAPATVNAALGITPREKPCTVGIGTRGGKSRGVGSGSRQRKCQCAMCGYTLRTSQKWIDVAIPICPVDQSIMVVG